MIRFVYMFFVGLFLAIFVGMGIQVFYPQPEAPDSLHYIGEQLTESEKKQQVLYDQREKEYQKDMQKYNRNASVIVLVCAVIILAVSFWVPDSVSVVADGLLMGGVFTLLYGIGRGMATDNNKFRFAVAAVGLFATILLGYLKFQDKNAVKKL